MSCTCRRPPPRRHRRGGPSPQHRDIRTHPAPVRAINDAWYDFDGRLRAADSQEAKLVIAQRARAVMAGFAALSPQHRALLIEADRTFTYPAEAAAARAAAEAAWSANPALAEYRAERLATEEARNAYLAAAAEEQRQQAEREAPARLLAMLKSRGLQVSLSTDGEHITMPPADAAALAPGEVAALKHHRAGIIAALAAEAEAARLVVVA